MSDLRLNALGDLDIVNGDLRLTQGSDAIRQHILQRLRTFLGEWFLDISVGVPYYQSILVKNPNFAIVEPLLKDTILTTPGVIELLSFELDYISETRKLFLRFNARTANETLVFAEELEAA